MTPEEIREARLSLGLTPDQAGPLLGYAAGAARQRISEIENGHRTPGAGVIRLLRAYLEGYRPEDWPEP